MGKLHENVMYYEYKYDYPVIESGKGSYLYGPDGERYLDGSSGAISVSLAHGREDMARTLYEQAKKLAYYHRDIATSHIVNKVSEHMHRLYGMDKFCIVSGGSEAVEIALKMARLHFVHRGMKTKHLIIGRWMSYHGYTAGALTVGGNPGRRAEFATDLYNDCKICAPYCYRCPFGKTCEDCNVECANVLEDEIVLHGAENVAGFIFEPVSGTSLGAVNPPAKYFHKIREICDKYDVLMIADEVMAGSGRTGTWTALEQFGVKADIMAMAKSIGGGYFPAGVAACTKEVAEPIEAYGTFSPGFTWTGNPLAAAIIEKTLTVIEEENLLENVKEQGKRLKSGLEELKKKHSVIGDVRGRGLMIGVEFVKDRETKEYLDPAIGFGQKFEEKCKDHHLLLMATARFDRGIRGDGAIMGPNFEVCQEEIDEMLGIIDEVLTEMEKEFLR